jgi:hypothetical protein
MKDFLRGTLGVFAQIVLLILGIVLIGASCVASLGVGNIVLLVLGILCLCAVAGIRYWLGHIVRMR